MQEMVLWDGMIEGSSLGMQMLGVHSLPPATSLTEEDAAWLLESCEKAASSFVEYALPEARAMTAEHQRLKQVMGSLGVKPPLRGHDYGKDMLNRVLASASATTPRNSEGQRSPRSPRP